MFGAFLMRPQPSSSVPQLCFRVGREQNTLECRGRGELRALSPIFRLCGKLLGILLEKRKAGLFSISSICDVDAAGVQKWLARRNRYQRG